MDIAELNNSNKVIFEHLVQKIANDKLLKYIVLAMIFSYFYNLPFIKYSLKGDNEFRIYDVFGFFVLYHFFVYHKFLKFIIKIIKPFRWLWMFLLYASFMCIVTLIFFAYFDVLIAFLQTLLYLYHFYIFFITSLFLYLLCFKKSNLVFFLNVMLLFSILCCLVVVLQNFNIIPFLWNASYLKSYQGFLSGTLGPNKIVLGITSLIMFTLSVGLIIEKSINVNRILILLSLFFNAYVILISGSRTTYVGAIIFLLVFAVLKTSKFVMYGFMFLVISLPVGVMNNDIYDKIEKVVDQRVTNKIRNKNNITDQKVGDLYEDLGAGRDKLLTSNLFFLLENPYIIPFGVGFTNFTVRGLGLSAHNMYLQVIKELGLVGFVLYFGWLIQYLLIDFKKYSGFSVALKGLVISMLVTLFFGEHLYIFRPLFAILGLFLAVTVLMISILHKNENNN